jgi:hypothetical protein
VYNHHKPTHEFSDQFSYQEIDVLDEQFKTMRKTPKPDKQPKPGSKTRQDWRPSKPRGR